MCWRTLSTTRRPPPSNPSPGSRDTAAMFATATTLDARVLVTGGYDGVILPTVDACLYLP